MIFFRVLFQTVFLALGQIWANKMRAILTTLGIIIGVAAVIAVVGAMSGLRGFVLKEFETFGAKKMYIWGWVPRELRTTMSWSDVRISLDEVEMLQNHAYAIDLITPTANARYDITAGRVTQRGALVTGIWPEWHEIENRSVTRGRPFFRIDMDERRQVCLVNDKAIEELELPRDPVGRFIDIKGRRFLIIGIVETKETSPMFGGGDSQSEVYIPFETSYQMNPYNWIDCIAQLRDPKLAEEGREEVRFVLRKARGLGPEEQDTFRIEVLQSIIDQFNKMAAGITAIAGGVVSIALLVGGIGIMNIMLVSVSERTREIGLRKAVGARPAIILNQFLVEAVVLCLVGGLVGVLLGQAATLGLRLSNPEAMERATVPPWAIIVAVAFSGATGVIFGMFPAIKAARLDPIEALRHE
ncbi:MAG: ABC transporter permease [Phycisphaeraceae bacterium]|nr:ABC transporter permease [Phycisphaeraceae bacterium]MCW5769043.1 ABC transporter permease [Phycisphaeraceae bacterium]